MSFYAWRLEIFIKLTCLNQATTYMHTSIHIYKTVEVGNVEKRKCSQVSTGKDRTREEKMGKKGESREKDVALVTLSKLLESALLDSGCTPGLLTYLSFSHPLG